MLAGLLAAACGSGPGHPVAQRTATTHIATSTTLPPVVTTPTTAASAQSDAEMACSDFTTFLYTDFPSLLHDQSRATSEAEGWSGEANSAAQASPSYSALAADMASAAGFVGSSSWSGSSPDNGVFTRVSSDCDAMPR